jgi:hypothetical protein
MTTWRPSAPAFGGYYEHAAVNGVQLMIRQTPNGRWTARAGDVKVRGSFATAAAARAAAERSAR